MDIVFHIGADSEANIRASSASFLEQAHPVMAMDWTRDILCDALDQYNAARVRAGFKPIESFSKG